MRPDMDQLRSQVKLMPESPFSEPWQQPAWLSLAGYVGSSIILPLAMIFVVFLLAFGVLPSLSQVERSLRIERQAIEVREQAELDREVKLDVVRQRIVHQHADLVAQQMAAQQLATENLKLARELNLRLRKQGE